ncbi:hypothetical protein AX17_001768 [Amanita inopinata Kibby_2008]|nr:hypothetical protein AX17_001768 [Amanita inopinata Kibby_2008]
MYSEEQGAGDTATKTPPLLPTSTTNVGPLTASPTSTPRLFSSLISPIFSSHGLPDWLKLMVLGGVVETCRRFMSVLYRKVDESMFITATMEEPDDSYDWMMHWLSKHPTWSKARTLRVSTRTYGLGSLATAIAGDDSDTSGLIGAKRKLTYVPGISTSTIIWYKRHWMRITRYERDVQNAYYHSREESLEIRIFSRSHQVLNDLLLEAKKDYLTAQADTICIYVSDSTNSWRHMASRPKRPLTSIILDPGMKDELLADAQDFLASKAWYATRGIPFRRGYLLYGAPGSGKTSIIHSLAGELGLDIYVISLSRSGLDDTGLAELIADLPEQCIALMEDIDAALTQTINRDANENDRPTASGQPSDGKPPSAQTTTSLSKVSLSGLLNALDGVGAQEGRILFATTNKYSALDPALCRPGRMDVHVEFKLASKFQARELYRIFYMPEPEEEEVEVEGAKEDSGYASKDESRDEKGDNAKDLIDLSEASTSEKIKSAPKADSNAVVTGSWHQRSAPELSKRTVETLADIFADAIPEREISMAALQGYLMVHKAQPMEAARNAKSWVEKQKADKQRHQGRATAS